METNVRANPDQTFPWVFKHIGMQAVAVCAPVDVPDIFRNWPEKGGKGGEGGDRADRK